jgi:hypothetical protein
MKKIFMLLSCLLSLQAASASDSLFQYILVPQQAKLKTQSSITFQLLKFSETQNRYTADLENGMTVEKWLINGKTSADNSSDGWFEGFQQWFLH